MEQQIIRTTRCILRPSAIEDAEWMFKLLVDKDVVSYIEGIKWFNADIESVSKFIKLMTDSKENNGMLWSIIYNDIPVGIIMVNDLKDRPFISFALFPEYRSLHIGTEVYNSVYRFISPSAETKNLKEEKVLRHKTEVLFIDGRYITSLEDFKNFLISLDAEKKRDLFLIDDVLALFRDGAILKWLHYLTENGDEEAFNRAYSISHISIDAGDRAVFRTLVKVFSGKQVYLQNVDFRSQISLSQMVTLKNESFETDVNLYRFINVPKELGTDFEIILSFNILKSSHDTIEVELNGKSQSLNLVEKRKTVKLPFTISIRNQIEETFDLKLDGVKTNTIVFQMYPPQDWDSEICTLEGVRNLYLQQYHKARLCFNKYESAADLFWLGIMSYIGCYGSIDPIKAFDYFQQASIKEDAKWSYIADCLKALMLMKGEGVIADLSQANKIISRHNISDAGLSLIKKAVSGNLTGVEYDRWLYAYNISDFDIIPKIYIELEGVSIMPFFISNTHKPFKIIVTSELSNELAKIDPKTDSLHAHIGVTNKLGDWQYTIDDWYENTENNTFIYNPELKNWELDIEDLHTAHNIPVNEQIFKINIILRNSTGEIEIRPTKDSYYIIDCFDNNVHVALCNVTPLLVKFESVAAIYNQIRLKNEWLRGSEIIDYVKNCYRIKNK